MWLLPVLSPLARLAARVYYRLDITGDTVPAGGPVLLVANHPNSLIDPALVAAAAGRPVRFLAKAPLFTDPLVGWLVRGAGAIPVYRRSDDPSAMGRNEEMFRAVHDEVARGAAVAIFPEGLSHSEPSLAPLKTGAARIALGARDIVGRTFPIIPIGLVFREKDIFRSEAAIVVGRQLDWEDLAARGLHDAGAVSALTERIDAALREVTVNLEQWEDAPLVASAEAIHAAELGDGAGENDPAARVERLRETTALLARLRRSDDPRWLPLAADVRAHAQRLRQLRLSPADLHEPTDLGTATRWAMKRIPFTGMPAILIAAAGTMLFWIPYRLTGVLERRAAPQPDVRSTHKVLTGSLLFVVWIVLLAGVAWWIEGGIAGLAALLVLPPLAVATVIVLERWRDARSDARRFFLLRRRRELMEEMRKRQRELAVRLEAVRVSFGGDH